MVFRNRTNVLIGGTKVKRETIINIQAMTIRELGDVAADRGVSAASLLAGSGPLRAATKHAQ